ncbi:MAG: lipopolysaccharide biosynthesis protein [Sandaracinaceae bacterium]
MTKSDISEGVGLPASASPNETAAAAPDEAKRAGRGFLWVASAKVLFIVSAFGVTVALPVLFGDDAVYGRFAVVFGAAALLNNVLISSTLQTVSKLVSEDPANARRSVRQALLLQLGIGLSLGGSIALFAPLIAEHVYHDGARTPLLRIAGAVVLCYAMYAALVGALNGQKRFDAQARLDMTFSFLRTAGLLGGAAAGFGAVGAFGGFGLAAMTILGIAMMVVGVGEPGSVIPWSRWRALLLPIAGYQAALSGLMLVDLQVLNVLGEHLASPLGADAARELADRLAAYYSGAQRFALVPYQTVLAVTFVVFPFVSQATAMGDEEAAKRYVAGAFRFSFLQLLMVAAPIAGAADGVLLVSFPDTYVAAADALRILIMGQVAFALFAIGATILTSGGHAAQALKIASAALVVVLVATTAAIYAVGVEGDAILAATAAGTSLGTLVAFAATGYSVYVMFGALIPMRSVVRGAIAGAVGFATAYFVPHTSVVGVLGAMIGGAIAYALTLAITGEVGKEELALVQRVLKR